MARTIPDLHGGSIARFAEIMLKAATVLDPAMQAPVGRTGDDFIICWKKRTANEFFF
jgi:hypothetical protein